MIITGILAALFASIFTDPATPHCVYEDASELTKPGQTCKWDAPEAGVNSLGSSFVVIVTDDGCPLYIYADGIVER